MFELGWLILDNEWSLSGSKLTRYLTMETSTSFSKWNVQRVLAMEKVQRGLIIDEVQ